MQIATTSTKGKIDKNTFWALVVSGVLLLILGYTVYAGTHGEAVSGWLVLPLV